jgi:uncharacterized membrane protein YozB (DUF420 family)
MFSFSELPLLNALLNGTSAILLVLGHRQMKLGNIERHKRLMIGVFVTSGAFLLSYIVYHYVHGSQPFQANGFIRVVYFTILISHTIGAVAIVPLALITLKRGLRRDDRRHAAIAKWTYPVWLYVSATGVIIYLMLYQLYPGGR